jgi:hypothetical protein
MKRLILIVAVLLAVTVVFVHADRKLGRTGINVDAWWGHQWELLDQTSGPLAKYDVVAGVLAGISAVRDYAFDVDPQMYEYYQAYSEFLLKQDVVGEIVDTLNRYYEENRDTYKYEDRVVTMILVIYGKYWWR